MKIFKLGLKQAGNFIFVAVMSFFLTLSIMMICTGLFTKEVGYTVDVYVNENDDEPIAHHEHYYADGDDLKYEEYKENDYFIAKNPIRSHLEGTGKAVFFVTTQVLTSILVIAFASNSCYKQGFKDINLVKIGEAKEDKLKGLKVGLIGNIPFFVLFVVAAAMAFGWLPSLNTVTYASFNSHYYPLIMTIGGTASKLSQLGIGQLILMFALQLIAPTISMIAYILGYKGVNFSEKILYKKEEK